MTCNSDSATTVMDDYYILTMGMSLAMEARLRHKMTLRQLGGTKPRKASKSRLSDSRRRPPAARRDRRDKAEMIL